MKSSLLVAGFGGQGIMMLGKLVGECAHEQGLNVTFLPSYGPEQRGGTANCTVIQSDEPIGSPASRRLDVLCAMNQPSLEKFVVDVKKDGVVLVNSSIVDPGAIDREDVKVAAIDADMMAYEIGERKTANVIMFAAYMTIADTMPLEKVKELSMKKLARKPELVPLNNAAFDKGVAAAREIIASWN
jgi:2-oxoglutarate ferredoxin oxidoreductase subunit gamma